MGKCLCLSFNVPFDVSALHRLHRLRIIVQQLVGIQAEFICVPTAYDRVVFEAVEAKRSV